MGLGIAALLATSVASAAGAGAGSGAGQKGDTGGKGGVGPQGSTAAGSGGSAEQGGSVDTSLVPLSKSGLNPDTGVQKAQQEKPWEIGGGFETHHLLEGNFLTTDASVKTVNVYSLYGRYNLTQNDTVSIGGGTQQLLQADATETGFRLFDISLGYTHRFQLPEKFNLATSGSLSVPISYYSQLASNITTPGVSISLSRRFGDLFVGLSLRGSYFWDKYTSQNALGAGQDGSAAGQGAGQPNVKWAAGGAITAEYTMPFHRPWSVGAALVDSYIWFYDVGSCPAQSACMGATSNPLVDGQPFQQSYGGEIFTRYILPDLQGFKSDITLALANGDPSIGYPGLLHDGVVHPYLLFYNSAEVYVALTGRY
ncbi:MAG TPA: hypothetical protein VMI75_38115 [Polyangiaceae bacterium]|nr:hypothetical protein [Polyangiaceae bacterium]